MEITRDDNGDYDLLRVTPSQLQIIVDALDVMNPDNAVSENAAIYMADLIRAELDHD